jgi:aminopeptidase N
VSNYLNKFAYANADTQDLWDSLQEVWNNNASSSSGLTVGRVMDTWSKQMGYPLISVAVNTAGHYEVHQERFLEDPDAKPNDTSPFK